MANPESLLFPLFGGLLGFLCLWAAFRSGRRQRLIEDIPTCKTTGVFIGCVELKGTAEAESPLISHLAGERCVWHEWDVQEHWSRTVRETYRDSNGRTQTRTRRESGWKTVDHGGRMIPFYLKDDCGVIRVEASGAQIEPRKIFDTTCEPSDPLYYSKGPASAVAHSDHRRRFSESAIPLHHPIYVIGQAREREDVVAPEIAADNHAPLFLISTRTEEQVRRGYRGAFWAWLFLGGVLAVGGGIIGVVGSIGIPALALAAIYVAASALAWVWMVYNSLVELRQRVRQGWSQVDVQLKRRHDLIPNLVGAVTGFRDHEETVHKELAGLRTQLRATGPGEAGPDYQACLPDLRAIVERYPELKASESFLKLQEALSDTEHRIALARAYFNDIATFYNTRLERVPDRFAARLASLPPQPLLTASGFEREPVKVTLESEREVAAT